jgi:hypothetical protein
MGESNMISSIHNGQMLNVDGYEQLYTLVMPNGYILKTCNSIVASGIKGASGLLGCIYEKPTPPESIGCVNDTFICHASQDAFLEYVSQNLPDWVKLPPMPGYARE